MSQSSEYSNDHQVRLLEIAEDEEAVIRVRTKFHVSLVFGNCTIELFEKNGVVYTKQEYRAPSESDNLSVGDPEYPSYLDTQTLEGDDYDDTQPVPGDTQLLETQPWDYEETDDPPDVIKFADGSFVQVNEIHEFKIQDVGDTQLEPCYDSNETTANGIYIPSYLRSGGDALLCPDSQPIEDY